MKFKIGKYSWVMMLIVIGTIVIGTIATTSAIFALVTREIQTRMTSGDVKITIDGLSETVALDGPIDFSHLGHKIKGDSGSLELERDEETEKRNPIIVSVNGNVRYSDDKGYSSSCAKVDLKFKSDIVTLSGNVSLSGNEMHLNASRVIYNRSDETIFADGVVHHEAKTKRISLLVGSELSGEPASDESGTNESGTNELGTNELGTYTVDCEEIQINDKSNTVIASGDVRFKLESTSISCMEVKLDYRDDEIVRIVCIGDVEFNDPDMNGNADIVIYSSEDGTLILKSNSSSSNVVVTYKGQKVQGKQIVLDLNNGRELTLEEGKVSIKPDELERVS